MDKQYYTIKEVAEKLHVCKRTIFRFINEGLKTYRLNAKIVRIAEDDLEEFLKAREDKKNIKGE